jgi:hypothetical protein
VPKFWQTIIFASIWFAIKTCQTLTFSLQICGNVFAQPLARQMFGMTNFYVNPIFGLFESFLLIFNKIYLCSDLTRD